MTNWDFPFKYWYAFCNQSRWLLCLLSEQKPTKLSNLPGTSCNFSLIFLERLLHNESNLMFVIFFGHLQFAPPIRVTPQKKKICPQKIHSLIHSPTTSCDTIVRIIKRSENNWRDDAAVCANHGVWCGHSCSKATDWQVWVLITQVCTVEGPCDVLRR